jgi:hypothetical protein
VLDNLRERIISVLQSTRVILLHVAVLFYCLVIAGSGTAVDESQKSVRRTPPHWQYRSATLSTSGDQSRSFFQKYLPIITNPQHCSAIQIPAGRINS